MDELRVELVLNSKPPHTRPYLNGEKLFRCREIAPLKNAKIVKDYINENGNREFKIYGNFEFVDGVLKERVRK